MCRRHCLEVMKTLISFTAVRQTGGVRDRQSEFLSSERKCFAVPLSYLEAEGEATPVLSQKL